MSVPIESDGKRGVFIQIERGKAAQDLNHKKEQISWRMTMQFPKRLAICFIMLAVGQAGLVLGALAHQQNERNSLCSAPKTKQN